MSTLAIILPALFAADATMLVTTPVPCGNGTFALPGRPCPLPGPFMVVFDHDSAAVTAEAERILDHVVEEYGPSGRPQTVITGHTDRAGGERHNLALSARRADAVLRYLIGRGLPVGSMRTVALGESGLLIETPDGIAERWNRRVVIRFEPAGGS